MLQSEVTYHVPEVAAAEKFGADPVHPEDG